MGALRLRDGLDGPFIDDREPPIPPYHDLRELQDLPPGGFGKTPRSPFDDHLVGLLVAPARRWGRRPAEGELRRAQLSPLDREVPLDDRPARLGGLGGGQCSVLARAAGIEVAETRLLALGGGGADVRDPPFRPDAGGPPAVRVGDDAQQPERRLAGT